MPDGQEEDNDMRTWINLALVAGASFIAGVLLKPTIDKYLDEIPEDYPQRDPGKTSFRDPDEYGFYSDRVPEPYFEPEIPDLM